MAGAHTDLVYQSYTGHKKIIAANGEKLDVISVHDLNLSTAMPFKLSNVFMVP